MADQGIFGEIETVSTLPDDFDGESTCADIHVAPSGRFVYGSNRGHDSIAMFAIDEATGRLTSLGNESTQGQTPRNFTIDPSGTWLLAANQDTNTIVTFRINPQTGHLHPTGHVNPDPQPRLHQAAADSVLAGAGRAVAVLNVSPTRPRTPRWVRFFLASPCPPAFP